LEWDRNVGEDIARNIGLKNVLTVGSGSSYPLDLICSDILEIWGTWDGMVTPIE
jgi:hypothetical protein